MKTKVINIDVSKNGIPAELYLYLGLESKKNKTYIYINSNDKLKDIINKTIVNLFEYFNNKNITILESPIGEIVNVVIPSKLNLYFSDKVTEDMITGGINLQSFINQFEKLFGKIPFYSKANAIIEKYIYINDVILRFGKDAISH